MVKIETCALLEVTQSVSGRAGAVFYPPTLEIRTSILSLLNTASCRGNRSGTTAMVPDKILRVSFPLLLAQGWKVISYVWLFTWGLKRTMLTQQCTRVLFTWIHLSLSLKGLTQGRGSAWVQHVVFTFRFAKLVSFFPSVLFCVWASNLPGPRWNTVSSSCQAKKNKI